MKSEEIEPLFSNEVELSVTYVHPDTRNDCPNIGDRITRNYFATGTTPDDACRKALVLAENNQPVCSYCAAFYQMKVVINTRK